jgi:predicted nucleic acid-binding protein
VRIVVDSNLLIRAFVSPDGLAGRLLIAIVDKGTACVFPMKSCWKLLASFVIPA